MSPADNINALLPIELFDGIFGYLTFAQQLAAMITCTHWFQILGYDRQRRRLRLNPTTLTDDLSADELRWMKQFRFVSISDCGPFGNFSNLLAEFVDQEVRDRVEELEVGLEWIDWETFFVDCRWPALRSLVIEAPRMEIPDVGEMRLIAPNLRKVVVADVSPSVAQLVQRFSGQLEEFSTVIRSMADFEFIFGRKEYRKLQKITLVTSLWKDADLWNDRDLTEYNLLMFSGLKHLKLQDWEEKFYAVLPTILGQTSSLESLSILGCGMSSSATKKVSKMIKLEVLNLSCRVEDTTPISLPNLQKLTTCYGAEFPVGFVPNLNWIMIKDNPFVKASETTREKVTLSETYFKSFVESLEVLYLEHIKLEDLLSQICSLKKIKVLNFVKVRATNLEISKLLTIKNLKSLRFAYCLLIKDRDSTFNDDIREWSQKIKHQYPNTATTFVNCRYL